MPPLLSSLSSRGRRAGTRVVPPRCARFDVDINDRDRDRDRNRNDDNAILLTGKGGEKAETTMTKGRGLQEEEEEDNNNDNNKDDDNGIPSATTAARAATISSGEMMIGDVCGNDDGGGGDGGERRSGDATRGGRRRPAMISTGGGAVCVLYSIYSTPTLLGEASKIWEVCRKSAGSLQEVGRNFFLSCYPTHSKYKILN